MFIVIPTSHDRMEVQRLPFITIGIAAICIAIHFITHFAAEPTEQLLKVVEKELVEFCAAYPDANLPEDVKKRLSPDSLEYLRQIGKFQEIMGWKDHLAAGAETSPPEEPASDDKAGEEVEDGEISYREEIETAFQEKIQKFRDALGDNYFHRWGYIPADGGFLKLVTSMFIHGGWLHLLANMLFLYLAGCTLEDLWGRIVFPLLYFSGGFVASWTHAHMYPGSTIACVGASGAIAALMGAFLIRQYNARIHFIYFGLIGFRAVSGKFKAAAYIMLPLWLMQQLFWGFLYSEQTDGGGVAFWAHIGGFGFGAVAALFLKVTGLEKKVLEPAVDKKSNLLDEDLSRGISKLDAGDANGAVFDLRKALAKNMDDTLTRGLLCRAYIKNGNIELASMEFQRYISRLIDQDDMEQAIEEYQELTWDHEGLAPAPETEITLMAAISASGKYKEAARAYERFVERSLKTAETKDPAVLLNVVLACSQIYLNDLDKPKEAFSLLRSTVQSTYPFSPDQKKQLITIAKKAKAMAIERARLQSRLGGTDTGGGQNGRAIPAVAVTPMPRATPAGKASIKIIHPVQAPPQRNIGSILPQEAGTVFPVPGGIDVKLMNHDPVMYGHIHLLCVFALASAKNDEAMADLFTGRMARPYRIFSTRISYRDFFDTLEPNNLDNFRKLLRQIISRSRSLFVDEPTLAFLKKGGVRNFATEEEAMAYKRNLWLQVLDKDRTECTHCGKINWFDKAPASDRKCVSCGFPLVTT